MKGGTRWDGWRFDGTMLGELLEDARFSQERLDDECDFRAGTTRRIVAGDFRSLFDWQAWRIAQVLGMSLDDLFYETHRRRPARGGSR